MMLPSTLNFKLSSYGLRIAARYFSTKYRSLPNAATVCIEEQASDAYAWSDQQNLGREEHFQAI
jgi:hypothetical protein